MTGNIRRFQLLGTAAFAAFACINPASAQRNGQDQSTNSVESTSPQAAETESAETDDIVVTASKSGAQTLQSTPLAIQAFTGEALKEKNIQDLTDMIGSIPGAAQGSSQSVVARAFVIRGVGVTGNGDSPIGYYVDDIPFTVPNFGIAPPIRFVDIDRVEVLRGPQGTLYGQGGEGGTILFHTRDPNLRDIQAAADISLSSTDGGGGLNYDASGAVSVPIVADQLAIRVSGGVTHNLGYADVFYGAPTGAPDERHANDDRNTDIRAVVLWKPAPNVTIRAQAWQFNPRQGYLDLLTSVDPPYFANTGGLQGYSRGKFNLYGLSAEIDLGGVQLTSATSYLKGNFGSLIPLGGGASLSTFFYPKSFNQELRLNSTGAGPFHWVVGGQYQDAQGPQANELVFPAIGLSQDTSNNSLTKNWAAFGEASYDLFDGKLVPLVGIRYYHDTRTYAATGVSLPRTSNVTTWRANLAYLPSRDLTVFVTASTGFRPGIIQSRIQADALAADGVPTGVVLEPETLTNYEIGVKWRSRSGALSAGVSAYHIDFRDLNVGLNSSTNNIGGFANLGNAHTNGIDLELNWKTPISGLSLGAVGNVNDGQFDEVDAAVSKALPNVYDGAPLLNTVHYNYQLTAAYERPVTDKVAFFGNVIWSEFGGRTSSSGLRAGAYGLLNSSLGLRRDQWSLSVFGENLINERGPSVIFNPGYYAGPRPRTIGLRLQANYQ